MSIGESLQRLREYDEKVLADLRTENTTLRAQVAAAKAWLEAFDSNSSVEAYSKEERAAIRALRKLVEKP